MDNMQQIIFSGNREYVISGEPVYQGQYSKLYKAQDLTFNRYVALKIIEGDIDNAEREIVVCCKLANYTSQVPVIIDSKREKDKLYIVMQWIAGTDLSEILQKGCPYQKKMAYAKDLCSIVSILHRNKYEHRDLKPDNIKVGNDGRIYLIDFNLSAIKKRRGDGSDCYRAPENDVSYAIKGNGNMDIFSIGVILYQMFTDHLPVPFIDYGGDYSDKEWSFFTEPIKFNPKISPKLNNIIVKCMKLNPLERYTNAKEIYNELKRM